MSANSFSTRDTLTVADTFSTIYRLDRLHNAERLPYGLKPCSKTSCEPRTAAPLPLTRSGR